MAVAGLFDFFSRKERQVQGNGSAFKMIALNVENGQN
jgi:hypothetical protein